MGTYPSRSFLFGESNGSFSRAMIPYARDEGSDVVAANAALHHHGIYAYRCGVLRRLVSAEPSDIEVCEQLEQLRALSLGMVIAVGIPAKRPGTGVDTEEDLQRAARESSISNPQSMTPSD